MRPTGGGSYTCISFGAPHTPLFAYHTLQVSQSRILPPSPSSYFQDVPHGFVIGAGSGFTGEEHPTTIFSGADSLRFKRRIDPGDIPTLLIPQLLATTSFQTNFSDVALLMPDMKNSSKHEKDGIREGSALFQTNFSLDPALNEVGTELLERRSTESAITQSHFQTTFDSAKSPEKITPPMSGPFEVTTEASVSEMATTDANDDSLVYVTPLPSHLEVALPPTDQLQP